MHGPLSDDTRMLGRLAYGTPAYGTRMFGTPIDGIKLQAHLTRAAIHQLLIQKCMVQQMENALNTIDGTHTVCMVPYTNCWYKNS